MIFIQGNCRNKIIWSISCFLISCRQVFSIVMCFRQSNLVTRVFSKMTSLFKLFITLDDRNLLLSLNSLYIRGVQYYRYIGIYCNIKPNDNISQYIFPRALEVIVNILHYTCTCNIFTITSRARVFFIKLPWFLRCTS